ncbi:hypothetical protein COY05_03170 [Candidatus Peregrinibacteria bacterium CG_4_10_14_0_2_um_filter_38_24]|nr:MAG: hypothetical protein COY05_03170 [Candidatus Peregrinibacteria bacterium CG_4_10_14_0_2_um_filter_38_24]PJC38959.1 MAG: hypothetical protein CO044_02285 [Candidatus Peregrinibacteria bacterium CG_4_9_14_0_2_um_filter_38_9]
MTIDKKIIKISIPSSGYLRIKVIPKSQRTEITEILDDKENGPTYKIKIAAPAEKGKANATLIKFLSKELKIQTEKISIISGKTEHLKLVKISA